jgi:DNA-binding NarL/FixJ family response regulator
MSEMKRPESALDVARRREAPSFFVVDEMLRVIFHTATANSTTTLPASVVATVRHLMDELTASSEPSAVAILSASEIVRLLRLEAADGANRFAVLVERFAVRSSVAKAAERYALSTRETEVLEGLMRGESTNEIAHRLGIAATTVQEHIRKVGDKTNVTKRSAIVATVFGLR